jgi:hypothetical protein
MVRYRYGTLLDYMAPQTVSSTSYQRVDSGPENRKSVVADRSNVQAADRRAGSPKAADPSVEATSV